MAVPQPYLEGRINIVRHPIRAHQCGCRLRRLHIITVDVTHAENLSKSSHDVVLEDAHCLADVGSKDWSSEECAEDLVTGLGLSRGCCPERCPYLSHICYSPETPHLTSYLQQTELCTSQN